MDQKIIDLYDEYAHAPLERRDFLQRLTALVGSAAAAASVLKILEPGHAAAQTVPEGDPRVTAEQVAYHGATGDVAGYLARPSEPGPHPAVIVIHENRGLTPYIRDVARRLAAAGYVALAPDLLSPLGGTPEDPDAARETIGQLAAEPTTQNLRAAIRYLEGLDGTTGAVGAVGFCWGGGQVGQLATAAPELDAAVVFYGAPPPTSEVPAIEAPLLLHYAGEDQRINEQVPAFVDALNAAGKDYQMHMYEGAQHAFHSEAAGARHDPQAAQLAWERTIGFFDARLKQG